MESINYLALIRGINVGGKNIIKMDELKRTFLELEFSDVETYIQSGNVLFRDYEKSKINLTKRIEKKLSEKLSNEIKVVVYGISEIEEIIKDIPKNFGKDTENFKFDVIFLVEPLRPNELMDKIQVKQDKDVIYVGSRSFYVKRSTEKLRGSYITEILKITKNITVRNLETTKKLYELMLKREREKR